MNATKINASFIISLIGHILLVLIIGIKIHFAKQEVNLGKHSSLLPSYLFQVNQLAQQISQNEVHKTVINTISKNAISLAKPLRASIQTKNVSSSSNTQEKHTQSMQKLNSDNGKPSSELITLLHEAIQEHQHYPESALQMEREGKTTLAFVLYPNGTIKDLNIVNSSGTESLDQAAIEAVNEAAPFQGVSKYLMQPGKYEITVEFELT